MTPPNSSLKQFLFPPPLSSVPRIPRWSVFVEPSVVRRAVSWFLNHTPTAHPSPISFGIVPESSSIFFAFQTLPYRRNVNPFFSSFASHFPGFDFWSSSGPWNSTKVTSAVDPSDCSSLPDPLTVPRNFSLLVFQKKTLSRGESFPPPSSPLPSE